jgi:hypothetical protein
MCFLHPLCDNRYLDRSLLIRPVERYDLAFFHKISLDRIDTLWQ